MPFELREMDFGQIIDRGIKTFKDRFVPLVILMAIFFGPFTFATNYIMSSITNNISDQDFITSLFENLQNAGNPDYMDDYSPNIFEDDESYRSFIIAMIFSAILLILTPLAYLSVFKVLSDYLIGRESDIKEVIKFGFSRFGTLIGAFVLCMLIFGAISFVLTLISGIISIAAGINMLAMLSIQMIIYLVIAIYLMVFFLILPNVVAMEKTNAWFSLKRTWWLLRGFWWRTFGIYLLTSLLVAIIIQIFLAIGQAIAGLFPDYAQVFYLAAISTLFSIIFQPVTLIITFLIYVDIRIRKENFNLDILVQRSEEEIIPEFESLT